MLALSSETQLSVYSCLRSLEARSASLDALVTTLKRTCVHGGPGAVPDMVAMISELRWQLRKVHDLSDEVHVHLGIAQPKERAQQPRPEWQEPPGLRGTTDVISVPDLIGTLSNLKKTGTLALQTADNMFVFELQDGRIVHAITNKQQPDLLLGSILLAQNAISEEQLNECLQASAHANEMLGGHLVNTATVSESDLRTALDTQVQKIFQAAFDLKAARFTFLENQLSSIEQRTTVNTTELLLDAARRADDRAFAKQQKAHQNTDSALDSILGK